MYHDPIPTTANLLESAPPMRPVQSRGDARKPALHPCKVRQLVFPPSGHGYHPTGLNAQGDVIGNIVNPIRFPGAKWTATGLYLPPHHFRNRTLPSAQMHYPFAGLNDEGIVVGTEGSTPETLGAWASHLGSFGRQFWPDHLSHAQDVNRRGDIVGKTLLAADPVLVARAFLMRAGENPRYFIPPEGGLSDAIAVNDQGAVLFNITALSTRSPQKRAWLWQDEEFLPLPLPPRCASTAVALNQCNDVVGFIENEFGLRRPVLWTEGRPQDLETLEAQDFRPACINNAQVIGGSALNAFAQRAACIWTQQQGLRFLPPPSDSAHETALHDVVAINDRGQILATQVRDKQSLGFLLEPTP
jgi:hypothetical protein